MTSNDLCVLSIKDQDGALARRAAVSTQAHPPQTARTAQTFSTVQLAACARRAGFTVLSCEYADGRLSNYPAFLSAEDPALRGREQVVLVAQKPLE